MKAKIEITINYDREFCNDFCLGLTSDIYYCQIFKQNIEMDENCDWLRCEKCVKYTENLD